MYHLLIFPAVKGGSAVAGTVMAHAATTKLALLYANHAVTAVGAHATAGHAAAAHASRVLPAGHHPGIHPMTNLFDDIAISAGVTVGALTFTNLYDHLLDELWASARNRFSAEDMREQMRHLAYVACRHAKKALRQIDKLTTEEIDRLNAVLDQLLRGLASMPLASPA
jgi:hypothetical protein